MLPYSYTRPLREWSDARLGTWNFCRCTDTNSLHIGWSRSRGLYSVDAWLNFDPRIVHRGYVGTLSYYRMCEQFGFLIHDVWFIEVTFPLNFDLVSRLRCVLFAPLCVCTVRLVYRHPSFWNLETVYRYAHDKYNKKLVNYYRFGAVHIYAIIWDFGWSVFAPVSGMYYSTAARVFHMQ